MCAAAEAAGGEGEHEQGTLARCDDFVNRSTLHGKSQYFHPSFGGDIGGLAMEKLLFVWLCVTVTLATFVPPARAFSPAVPVPTFRTCVSPARCAAPVGQVRMGNEIRGSPEKWRKIVAAVRSEAVVPQRVAIVGAGAVG